MPKHTIRPVFVALTLLWSLVSASSSSAQNSDPVNQYDVRKFDIRGIHLGMRKDAVLKLYNKNEWGSADESGERPDYDFENSVSYHNKDYEFTITYCTFETSNKLKHYTKEDVVCELEYLPIRTISLEDRKNFIDAAISKYGPFTFFDFFSGEMSWCSYRLSNRYSNDIPHHCGDNIKWDAGFENGGVRDGDIAAQADIVFLTSGYSEDGRLKYRGGLVFKDKDIIGIAKMYAAAHRDEMHKPNATPKF